MKPRIPRNQVRRPGRVIIGRRDFRCQILDMSRNGARLGFQQVTALPSTFELEDTFTNERWQARLVWRKSDSAGVRLLGPPPSSSVPPRTFGRKT